MKFSQVVSVLCLAAVANAGVISSESSGWSPAASSGWEAAPAQASSGWEPQEASSGWEAPAASAGWEAPASSGWEAPAAAPSEWESSAPASAGWEAAPVSSGWEAPSAGWAPAHQPEPEKKIIIVKQQQQHGNVGSSLTVAGPTHVIKTIHQVRTVDQGGKILHKSEGAQQAKILVVKSIGAAQVSHGSQGWPQQVAAPAGWH